jgi:hypothetical protein
MIPVFEASRPHIRAKGVLLCMVDGLQTEAGLTQVTSFTGKRPGSRRVFCVQGLTFGSHIINPELVL